MAQSRMKASLAQIQKIIGDRLQLAQEVRKAHSHDISWHRAKLPAAVCFPNSTEEVAEIVRICAYHRMPIVPYGAGTSVEGHIIPQVDAISMDLSLMNQIKAVYPVDRDCVVQAGVGKVQLNKALEAEGLFFAAGPGIDASLGGIAATAASGANAIKYGTAKENIRALEVVTAQGEILKTGSRVKKTAAGYDLTHLMIGSEGTLGIITELTAILHPIPSYAGVAVIGFPDIQSAIYAAIDLIRADLPLAMLEFMDEVILSIVNEYAKSDYPPHPSLFVELHCDERMANAYATVVKNISETHGGLGFTWATELQDRKSLWKNRYDAALAVKAIRPEGAIMPTDVCVPISKLAECVLETKLALNNIPLALPFLGHVGDGNFHIVPNILISEPAELSMVKTINDTVIQKALALGGTCTAEHGIGLGKKSYLEQELGKPAVDMMRRIKQALDPQGILNPGKVVD